MTIYDAPRDAYEQALGDMQALTWSPDALWALRWRGVRDALLVTACKGDLDWGHLLFWSDTTVRSLDNGLPAWHEVPLPSYDQTRQAFASAALLRAMSYRALGDKHSFEVSLLRCPDDDLTRMVANSADILPLERWCAMMTALTVDTCLTFAEEEEQA